MKIPDNKWMNDPNVLAQFGHVLGGAWIVFGLGLFFGWVPAAVGAAVVCALAAVKEWWYDAYHEIPHQTWRDNLLDHSMWTLGGLLGLGVWFLAHALGRLK